MHAMRGFVLVLLLALFATGAWFLLGRGDEAPPLPPALPGATPNQPTTPPVPAQSAPRVNAGAPDPKATPANPDGTAANPTPPVPAATPANVLLAVRDLTTREPVAAFRWRFQNSRGTLTGQGQDGRAELVLEPSAVGKLLVESEGHAPLAKDGLIAPTPPAGPLTVDLFLAPAVPAAGITLFVRDTALAPIPHVRVDAFALTEVNASTAWQLGQPLWARLAQADDGKYTLPAVPAGTYGIRVVGVDERGETLPLLPWQRTFALTGDNGFVEDVALEPGALLALDLVDAAGQPLDPVRLGATVTLSLRLVNGPDVKRKWVVRGNGAEAAANDVLPGVGRVQLADAVLPGPYRLDVLVRAQPRVQNHTIFLRAGLRNEERIVVP